MSRGDPQKRKGWSLRGSPALLPIAQGMNTDPQGTCELRLRHSDKTPQRDYIVTSRYFATSDSLAELSGNRTSEISVGQLSNFIFHIILANMPRRAPVLS